MRAASRSTTRPFRLFAVALPGGLYYDKKWESISDVIAFDLPDEGDDHRVGFSCWGVAGPSGGWTGDNVALVQRAFSQPWESVETGVGGGPTPGVTGSFATPFRASEGVIVLAEFIFN